MNDREAQLRRRMLVLAKLRDQNFAPAAMYADDATDDEGGKCDNDEHASRLLNDLVEWGLLELARDPHAQAGVKREFRHRRFRITSKGWALWMQDIPPMAGVADSRWEAE